MDASSNPAFLIFVIQLHQDLSDRAKGYVVSCDKSDKKVCCPSPWSTDCKDLDAGSSSVCFADFRSCDGGRCIHPTWVDDDWPDCLDGSDEASNPRLPDKQMVLPRQLVRLPHKNISCA